MMAKTWRVCEAILTSFGSQEYQGRSKCVSEVIQLIRLVTTVQVRTWLYNYLFTIKSVNCER